MTFFVILGIVLFIAILAGLAKAGKANNIAQRVALQYATSDVFVSTEDNSFVALDFAGNQIILSTGSYEATYGFHQIASVEVIESGVTLTQTNRGSQVLGAIVGGVALGGIGSLIGGLSGSSRSRARLNNLSLKVIVDDPRNPVFNILFFKASNQKGVAPDSLLAKPSVEAIEKIHGQCIVAMRRVEAAPPTRSAAVSIQAHEIEKLWELKTKGALTAEEFNSQKALLLGSSTSSLLASPLSTNDLNH